MAEKIKVDIYIAYLDQLLVGETNNGPIEDEEIEMLLQLGKTMIEADFSVNSQLKENLKKQLLSQVVRESSISVLSRNTGELDDEDLEQVAAGFTGQAGQQKDFCPYCGYRLTKSEKCPVCSY